ncbi:MAG TPA: hypothetical protein VKU00_01460 [Chthonomonadaceae bacterium]|nr:hypothetical protein [Chthonomonadaceae bacterium]
MHKQVMRTILGGALAAVLFGLGGSQARAQFSETFDSGSATYTTNDPYWVNQSLANGFITKTTNSSSVFGGAFGNGIPQDVSGNGYFLFIGTASYPGNGGNIPAGQDQFYISPTFTVAPNSLYNVSFYLTDANGINNPSIQPEIGGMLLGSPVSPVGTFAGNGWQQFNFTWNSGSSTSASLILHDYTQTPFGNDFGVDDITVSAVAPEGSTLTLLCGGLIPVGFAVAFARRKQRPRA